MASYKPAVAVLIPAYNEEKVIERTVRAVLDSDYPGLHVIVIDDGSTDNTLEVARQAFADEEASGRVLILTKPNSGKAEALNFGLEHLSDEEIFVGIDADTVIARNAISRLGSAFPQSQSRGGRGKRQSWESREPVDPMAGAGIHHQPELRAPGAERSRSRKRGAGRDRRVEDIRGSRSWRIPHRHRGRRCRSDHGVAAARLPRAV